MKNHLVILILVVLAMVSCDRARAPVALDKLTGQQQAIVIKDKNDKSRLQVIHGRLEQLKLKIEHQQMMQERYALMGDFERFKRSEYRQKVIEDEIWKLLAERDLIYKNAAKDL